MPTKKRRPSRRRTPRNLADALLRLPTGTINHDELTELTLSLLSDLHEPSLAAVPAAITSKVRSLEILLKTLQDKRESEKDDADGSTPLVEILKGLANK